MLPNVDRVIDHVRLAEDVEFRVQQLVLIVNLKCNTCDITKKRTPWGARRPVTAPLPASPTGIPAAETPNAGPSIGLCGTLSRISPSRHLRFNVGQLGELAESNPAAKNEEVFLSLPLTQRGARRPEVGDNSRADSPDMYAIRRSRSENRKEETTDWLAKGTS